MEGISEKENRRGTDMVRRVSESHAEHQKWRRRTQAERKGSGERRGEGFHVSVLPTRLSIPFTMYFLIILFGFDGQNNRELKKRKYPRRDSPHLLVSYVSIISSSLPNCLFLGSLRFFFVESTPKDTNLLQSGTLSMSTDAD